MSVDCLINKKKVSWAKVFEQSIQKQVENLQIVSIYYLMAYAINFLVKEDLLSKMEKKEYDAIKWSLDEGGKWLDEKEPEEGQNPDEGDKERETEEEEDKDQTLDTTPRRNSAKRTKLERLSKAGKKLEAKKFMTFGSKKSTPWVGEAGASRNPDKWGPSRQWIRPNGG
jgi:hypothetical protein